MQRVIYIDVLIFLNCFITAMLLLACAALLKLRPRRLRLLLATLLGGAMSLVILLPPLPTALGVLIKIAGCGLLAWLAFGFRSLRFYLRAAGCFMMASFIFAGAMLALWSLLAPQGMVFNNGAAYWDISVLLLCVSTILCYALVRLLALLTRRNAPENHVFDLTINAGGKELSCKALFDSGSSLREGFSGAPVIVAQRDALHAIAPPEVLAFEEAGAKPELSALRLIPFNSVGGTGLLPAFRASSAVAVRGKKRWLCDEVYIAVSDRAPAGGEYTALLGNVFFEQCREVRNGKNT
ncbi:MAG: sigma-E processing peptidase SpoIIGA [Clostridium sp.]|jgi:stage II sporulation protein GA (sporulation sigma-E factor processing peptidase)|nr:sigma-E processing peptidase SpoIIGA [Clostridium sp.]